MRPELAVGDGTFQRIGGDQGLRKLVDAFYRAMDSLEHVREIREMHAMDLEDASDKLWAFLCGWMGGPRRYQEIYGHGIRIPHAHVQFPITQAHAEQWLDCMQVAVDEVITDDSELATYLMTAFRVPAERIVAYRQRAQDSGTIAL